MSQFKALLSKEVKEAVRDKRALMAGMIMAFLAPLLIFAISKTAISDVAEKPDIFVEIEGQTHAPDLMKVLENEGILPLEQADEGQQAQWETRPISIIIPDNYRNLMQGGRGIDVVVRADLSDNAISTPVRRINDAITDYARDISAKRILLRGISPEVLAPIRIQEQDTATPNSSAMFINSMLMLYMLFGAFIIGLSIAVDTSAGERERNVLELLLSQPVSTKHVVGAKLASASLVSITGVILTLVLTAFAMEFVDLSAIGASFQLDTYTVTMLILLLVPICLFASIIQLYLAFQAKTFKEAQSTVSMIILLPAMVPFALMMMDNKPAWLDWLPISGQYLLMEDILRGAPAELSMVIFVSLVTLVVTAALFILLSQKLMSEKTVLALS